MVTAGFYGKLPAHGDFIDRGLPGEFIQFWDQWLQAGMAGSQTVLKEQWLDAYRNGPAWNFVLSPGICGDLTWTGVIVPSVDKVGRYFPLTIAAGVVEPVVPPYFLVGGGEWHDAVALLAKSAIERQDVNANVFAEALSGATPLNVMSAVKATESSGTVVQPENVVAMPLMYGSTPGQGLLAFTHRLLESTFRSPYALWWTHGVYPGAFACSALPPPESFGALLSDSAYAPGWYRMPGYALSGGDGAVPAGVPAAAAPGVVDAAPAPAPAEVMQPFQEQGGPPQLDGLLGEPQAGGAALDRTPPPDAALSMDMPEPLGEPLETPAEDFVAPEQISSDDILAGLGDAPDEPEAADATAPAAAPAAEPLATLEPEPAIEAAALEDTEATPTAVDADADATEAGEADAGEDPDVEVEDEATTQRVPRPPLNPEACE